jgi:Mce-associated membrane protein
MTVEQGSSLNSIETPPGCEAEKQSAREGSARPRGLVAIGRLSRNWLARWRPILATALVTATIAVAAGLFFFQYRPDQRFGDQATHQVVQAASDGGVAVLSYSYSNLDSDFAKAKSRLTGEFLVYYSKFSQDFIAPAARQGQLTATAKVLRAAVSQLHPDSAVVLVFINQNTASKEKPEPLTTASSVLVTLTKVKGSWLIAKLDPL